MLIEEWWNGDADYLRGPFRKEAQARALGPMVVKYTVESGLRPGKEPCAWCYAPCECDSVDVGVGYVQCGPYHCERCGASQMAPSGNDNHRATEEERKRGWFGPGGPVSVDANRIGGKLVGHHAAKVAYRLGMLDEKAT